MDLLVCRGLRKRFGSVRVLPPTDLTLAEGSVTALIGASGCGKSTLLRLIAGLLPPDGGEILLDGQACRAPGPSRLLVFQEESLFPWLSVADNVGFGLGGLPAMVRRRCVAAMLASVGLSGWENVLPGALSGGMRQRAALARALIMQPRLLLLDEPFAALDAITRERMQRLLVDVQARTRQTMLLVTHDVEEACLLADTVCLMAERRGIVSAQALALPRPRAVDAPAVVAARGSLHAALTASMGGAGAPFSGGES
ncbi:ABC transporter ATP-binding protein [uncultured Desulfovibrio sp.]|uniref:ABC transporter ATP-binding protein n=1 Tax=uncultured Desulfovibrio sp. TaxID=167968 RepID=UPI0026060427|nr:ABC transporter ATP-binding protein [uncultured Desulfovibrio sp.]